MMAMISIVYLGGASGIMVWRGIEPSPDYILFLMVPVALVAGRLTRFLKDWIPFVALFLGYEALRGIAPDLGLAPHVGDVAFIERTLFLGHYPSVLLQGLTPPGTLRDVVSFAATAVYLCHFIFPFAIAAVLWHTHRVQFLRFSTALVGMSFVAFLFYLLVPSAPPWYAQNQGTLCCLTDVVSNALPTAWSPIYHLFDADLFAAFPSLHAAYPFLGYLAVRRIFPRTSRGVLVWAVVVWVAIVYLGEHYVVDVIGGAALAATAWAVVVRLIPGPQAAEPPGDDRVPVDPAMELATVG
jgi:membrane-associated phospholipid phosphatase